MKNRHLSMKLGLNPFGCDCKNKHFFTFVKQNHERIKDVSNITLYCDTPINILEAEINDFCQDMMIFDTVLDD